MDQQALRELENRCIQEEPPWCTATCPLHVDARALAHKIGQGLWREAWAILRKQMPLAGILGHICDAPCEQRCRRGAAGGAVRIGALERTCVGTDAPPFNVQPLPARGQHIAVAGSGLSSLTAAWDLARKGYQVTVFEAGSLPGAPLRRLPPRFLPPEAIDREIALLEALGIRFELRCDPDSGETIHRCLTAFDAVYLGLDALAGDGWDLKRSHDGVVRYDAATGSTSHDRLFTGGNRASPVWQAAQGRWAATSIDRCLQDVSLTAGRERERPFETRLFTNLTDVVSLPPVPISDETAGYACDEAKAEARRCLQCACLECVKVCAYLEQYKAYPKKYAREVYNNLSIVMGERKANRLINSCSLCGLCEAVCPNDFAMQDLCLQARRLMVESGRMPPSAHEFALEDMAFSQSEGFALARHQPGRKASTHVFFPGCQLCASAPWQVEKVYAHLRSSLPGGVGLILGCCAAPAHWAGRDDLRDELLAVLKAQWDALGRPAMILACATCLQVFGDHLPEISIAPLWTVLEDYPPPMAEDMRCSLLAIHDPCTTRGKDRVQEGVRRLLGGLGVETEELPLGRSRTECCGFGGLMQNANPDLAREVARRRGERSQVDYITYCAMCRDNLAATGKRTMHLLDLYYPEPNSTDPMVRPRPGWSRRRENRARLKADLLNQLWNEAPFPMDAPKTIRLKMSREVSDLLDRRRILEDDVKQVIAHAEASGERLFHPSSGHFKAALCPRTVTFWVEYTRGPDGCYEIYNAYAHRMEVLGP